MALFKVYHGARTNLPSTYTSGYAYFCEDDGSFWIDVAGTGGTTGTRVQVNAGTADSATKLLSGATTVEIDDIVLTSDVINAAHGGTGLATLTANAVLTGNGTGTVKLVTTASGALYATSANGAAQFGTLPVAQGGTGATTAANARSNLSVYSKTETDSAVTAATTVSYTTTLYASNWTASGDNYVYNYSNTSLTCGKAGNVPPIVTYTSNLDEYSEIDSAEATAGSGIVFTTSTQPTSDIGIIIIDVK